jgi:uncharacterized protein YbaP (TraB family)
MYYEIIGTQVRLAGSLHRLPIASPDLPQWIWRAYEWSEELIFEADATDALKYFFAADGPSLKSKLPSATWDALLRVWPPATVANLHTMKPWGVLLTLSHLAIASKVGVEPLLTGRAKQDGKPIRYVETMSEFARLADGVPDSVYAPLIAKVVGNLPQAARTMLEVHDAWRSGRIENVEAVLPRTILAESPLVKTVVMDLRNANWLPAILAALRTDKKTLIAVGALHLPQPTGLLALLAIAGYELCPLPLD